jgi:hypothetical protein
MKLNLDRDDRIECGERQPTISSQDCSAEEQVHSVVVARVPSTFLVSTIPFLRFGIV